MEGVAGSIRASNGNQIASLEGIILATKTSSIVNYK